MLIKKLVLIEIVHEALAISGAPFICCLCLLSPARQLFVVSVCLSCACIHAHYVCLLGKKPIQITACTSATNPTARPHWPTAGTSTHLPRLPTITAMPAMPSHQPPGPTTWGQQAQAQELSRQKVFGIFSLQPEEYRHTKPCPRTPPRICGTSSSRPSRFPCTCNAATANPRPRPPSFSKARLASQRCSSTFPRSTSTARSTFTRHARALP